MKTVIIALASAAAMLSFLIVIALLRTGGASSPGASGATGTASAQPANSLPQTVDNSSTFIATDEEIDWSTIDANNSSGRIEAIDSTDSSATGISWTDDFEQELEEGLKAAAPAPASRGPSVSNPSPRASRDERVEAQSPNPTKDLDLQLTLEQTAKISTSLRNRDFPNTYISRIDVDLTSPNHWVRLTWSGPEAASQETGPFHSSPGRGLGNNNCDDVAESRRQNSNCTPKGTMQVQGFSEDMRTCRHCKFVTWFNIRREVAFHYYPDVPNYPASHGCVRLEDMHAAQLIHNNSKIGATEVIVDGTWTFGY